MTRTQRPKYRPTDAGAIESRVAGSTLHRQLEKRVNGVAVVVPCGFNFFFQLTLLLLEVVDSGVNGNPS